MEILQKLWREKLTSNRIQDVLHFGISIVFVVLHPLEHSIVHLTFLLNIQLVFSYEVDQLYGRQLQELFFLTDLSEVPLDELIRFLSQHRAAVLLGKAGDADGICRIELTLEKGTARFYHVGNLKHCCCGQELAHRHLGDSDASGVHEADYSGHACRAHALEFDSCHFALFQAAGEHCLVSWEEQ